MTAPILANSCARAATAAEARYRIDAPIAPSRGALVIALDDGAVDVAHVAAAESWSSARFLRCAPGAGNDAVLTGIAGGEANLAEQLANAYVVLMIATADSAATCASWIGRACVKRGIMTAAVVVGDGQDSQRAVAALRPHARVLHPDGDINDVVGLLTALRA